jgi:tetrahydromethanopterin S-methyltransferase subunit B
MKKLTVKDILLVQLAEKGGTNADLLLLDRVNQVDDKVDQVSVDLNEKLDSSIKGLEETVSKVEAQKGDKGEQGIAGKDGLDGKNGIDGLNGKDGRDGIDGEDGEDGQDGEDAPPVNNQEIIDACMKPMMEMMTKMQAEFDAKMKSVSDKKPTVYGPGKTRIIKYDLSSQLNGVTKTFILGTHFGIISVQSSSAPFGAWRETIDYTEVGKTIVFDPSLDASVYLAAGQSLIVKVMR